MKRDGFDLHFCEEGDFLKHRVNGMVIPLYFDIVQCAWFLHFTCDPQTGEFVRTLYYKLSSRSSS